MSDLLKVRVSGNSYLCKWVKPNTVEIGGREYRTVKIGNQIWMAENLDYKWTGLSIGPSGAPSTQAAWYYNNDESTYGVNGYKCGLLYNRYALQYLENNKSTLLPDGWHVPSRYDWDELVTFVGGYATAGKKLKAVDNSITAGFPSGWNGTDEYGFGAIPTGYRDSQGTFNIMDTYCCLQGYYASTGGTTDEGRQCFNRYDTFETCSIFFTASGAVRLVKSLS